MTVPAEYVAQACHEANRVLQIAQADPAIPVSPHWEDLDEETRASAVSGVVAARGGATPAESHQGWMAFKIEHGWTLGPVKSDVEKTHPLLVPYEELPLSQQLKDHLFLAIVKELS